MFLMMRMRIRLIVSKYDFSLMTDGQKQIYSAGVHDGREMRDLELVVFLEHRISNHVGCRGLVSTCVQCIFARQILSLVKGDR